MFRRILIVLLTYFFAFPVNASKLGDLASSMSAGTFAEITGSTNYNFGGVGGGIWVPLDSPGGCGTGDYITQFATNAAYDQSRGVIRFIGQSHGNCTSGRFVGYTIATDTWDQGTPSGTLAWPSAFVGQYAGSGGPGCAPLCLNHEWDQFNAVRPTDSLQVMWIGPNAIQYNPATNTWAQAGGTAYPCCVHGSSTNSFRWFPDANKFIFANPDYGAYFLDPANNFSNNSTAAWTYIICGSTCFAATAPMQAGSIYDSDAGHSNSLMAYDRVHGFMYYATGSFGFGRFSASGTWTKLANCPVECQLNTATMAGDPVTGEIVLLSNQGAVHAYNQNTGWRSVAVSVPGLFSGGVPGAFSTISTPLWDYGVIWFARYNSPTSQGTWIYKHTAGAPDTQAPTAPTGLTVTP